MSGVLRITPDQEFIYRVDILRVSMTEGDCECVPGKRCIWCIMRDNNPAPEAK